MNRGSILLCFALSLSLLVSGCARDVSGTAIATPTAGPEVQSFGQFVTEEEQFELLTADDIRTTDPCGVLSVEFLSTLGSVKWLSPQINLGICSAIVVETNSRRRVDIRIDVDGSPPWEDDVPIMLGATRAFRDDTFTRENQCGVKIPMPRKYPAPASWTGFEPYVNLVVEQRGADTCPLADSIGTNLIPRLQPDRARRTETSPALGHRSPCEMIEALPVGFSINRWEIDDRPFACELNVDGPGIINQYFDIDFELVPNYKELHLNSETRIPVGNTSMYSHTNFGQCFVEAEVGPRVTPVFGTDAELKELGSIPVVEFQGGDCDYTHQLASSFVERLAR